MTWTRTGARSRPWHAIATSTASCRPAAPWLRPGSSTRAPASQRRCAASCAPSRTDARPTRSPSHPDPSRPFAAQMEVAVVVSSTGGAATPSPPSPDLDVLPESDPVVDLRHPGLWRLVRPRGAGAGLVAEHEVVELHAVRALRIARGLRGGAEQVHAHGLAGEV